MNEDIFKTNQYTVEFENMVDVFYLLPWGDVHDGNPNCHYQMFDEWCEWASRKKRTIFLGMGDYQEWFSESERLGMNSVRLHQSSKKTLDDFAKESVVKFYKKVKFMKGKVLGMMEGNHFYLFENGMTSTQLLCQMLECPYLGASALSRITFLYAKGKSKWSCSVDIFSHHGKGASRLVGGSLNTVQQMAECAEASIYLMGHDHKKSIGMSSKLGLTAGSNGLCLREKKLLYARTGSFLKGYEDGEPSYVAKKLLNPCDLGTVKIELTPKQKRRYKDHKNISSKLYVDIHASL